MIRLLGFLVGLGLVHCAIHRSSETKGSKWLIYTSEDFHKNDLCRVLNCKKDEICMVRNNNAMCVNKKKVSHIKGEKAFFNHKNEKLWSRRHEKQLDFDHTDELRKSNKHKSEKSLHHSMKTKDENKLKAKTMRTHMPDCTIDELKSMGGRLLQWFSDVHRVERGVVATLPHHKKSCREDVSWMFQQLDGNGDGELAVEELSSLEEDPYEHCIRPFLDRCDTDDVDSTLSLDEWCDCFEWVDDARKEPPCHRDRHSSDPHAPDAFIPRCDVDGFFRPEQCHQRQCYCVDRWGREFDHSRVHGRADCGQYAEPDSDDEDLLGENGSGDQTREL